MYALLSEGSEQEIISLDLFTPTEFGAVLDYMYGQPLEFNIEVLNSLSGPTNSLNLRMLNQCLKLFVG